LDGDTGSAAGGPIEKPVVQVRVTGHDYQWRIRYAGPDGLLDSDDDLLNARNLFLPAHAQIHLELCSDDFAYTFCLPNQDLMEVAVPGLPFAIEFQTDDPGTHELLGSQMCGYIHPLLIGRVEVGQWPPRRE
jgi:heme/copper-type cytochrome/quinol oxidase subunit 2